VTAGEIIRNQTIVDQANRDAKAAAARGSGGEATPLSGSFSFWRVSSLLKVVDDASRCWLASIHYGCFWSGIAPPIVCCFCGGFAVAEAPCVEKIAVACTLVASWGTRLGNPNAIGSRNYWLVLFLVFWQVYVAGSLGRCRQQVF
jgi:hypothetical protein